MAKTPSNPPTDEGPPPAIPDHIGNFRITRVLGAGGFATVYAARQEHPKRTVALKVMKAGAASARAMRRFKREVDILAKLRHPCIAPVFAAGTFDEGDGPSPYFVMEYIPGAKTILEFAAAKSLSVHDRLKLFLKVCSAVQHGHQQRVVHRDLKPQNVLVDEHGQPKVIDFGIATVMDIDVASTETDEELIVGTLQYMAPEQTETSERDVDRRADVYSLGVLLYRLLCGKLPYVISGMPPQEAVRVIRQQPPIKPSDSKPNVKGDLESIILKAIDKDPAARYASAGGLGRDILRVLNDEPIKARSASAMYRLRLFAKRHRVAVTSSLVVGALLLTAGAMVLHFANKADKAEHAAARANGDANTAEADEQARIGAAQSLQPRFGEPAAAPAPLEPFSLPGHTGGWATCLAFSTDGAWLASGGANNNVIVWDLESRERRFVLREQDSEVTAVSFDAAGGRLAVGALDGRVILYELTTGDVLRRRNPHTAAVNLLAFSPNGAQLASVAGDMTLSLWNIESRDSQTLRSSDGEFLSVAFSADSTFLAAGAASGPVYLFVADSGIRETRLRGLNAGAAALCFLSQQPYLTAVSLDDGALSWRLPDRQSSTPFGSAETRLAMAEFDPSGRFLSYVREEDASIRVWEVMGGGPERPVALADPSALIASLAVGPGGAWVAVGTEAGPILLTPTGITPR